MGAQTGQARDAIYCWWPLWMFGGSCNPILMVKEWYDPIHPLVFMFGFIKFIISVKYPKGILQFLNFGILFPNSIFRNGPLGLAIVAGYPMTWKKIGPGSWELLEHGNIFGWKKRCFSYGFSYDIWEFFSRNMFLIVTAPSFLLLKTES